MGTVTTTSNLWLSPSPPLPCGAALGRRRTCSSQTHATGQLLREATHINKSLHFLELVIKTLAEKKSDVFIPYRNSMMTNVLRDRFDTGHVCFVVLPA